MDTNLSSLSEFVLSKLLFLATNFIDDLCFLLLSHLGIHLPWLELLSSILIAGKVIYAVAKLSSGWYRQKFQNA